MDQWNPEAAAYMGKVGGANAENVGCQGTCADEIVHVVRNAKTPKTSGKNSLVERRRMRDEDFPPEPRPDLGPHVGEARLVPYVAPRHSVDAYDWNKDP